MMNTAGLRCGAPYRGGTILAVAVGLAIAATPLLAQTKTWIGTNGGPSGSWDNPAGWAPAGQPRGGDDVTIALSGANVTYANTAFPDVVLTGLNVGAAGGIATLSQGQDVLNTSRLAVGGAGIGAIDQSGGTLNVLTADGAVLGDTPTGIGTYALSGSGQLNVAGQLLVGDVGPGTFTQSAGAVKVSSVGGLPGTLAVGAGLASVGAYTMTGGSVETSVLQLAPFGGIAMFNQSAGQVIVAQELAVGDTLGLGSLGSGTYDHAAGTLTSPLVTIGAGGTLKHSGGIFRTGELTIDTTAPGDEGGRVDVTDKNFIIEYSGASPLTNVKGYIQSGSAGGDWDGAGIMSSNAQTTAGAAVGYAEASDVLGLSGNATGLWNGYVVDSTTILVDYTRGGDANLNGAVGFDDLVRLAQNYNDTSGTAVWGEGDFNYDGNVGFEDLVILAQNYGQALPAGPIAGAPGAFAEDLARVGGQVPEPGGVLVLGVVVFNAARRRRIQV
jgi:hypothetical protein